MDVEKRKCGCTGEESVDTGKEIVNAQKKSCGYPGEENVDIRKKGADIRKEDDDGLGLTTGNAGWNCLVPAGIFFEKTVCKSVNVPPFLSSGVRLCHAVNGVFIGKGLHFSRHTSADSAAGRRCCCRKMRWGGASRS